MKYSIMLNILDEICKEAPDQYKSYKPLPSDTEKLNQARSKAYIHLYLKVKCGLVDFKARHALITDEGGDGGVDAYFINSERKKLYLIQSKFRITENNFKAKSIDARELVKMEVQRIIKGKKTDSNDNAFNNKIQKFQKEWSEIRDNANYDIVVVILGNIKRLNDTQIRRLIDNSKYEVFDYNRTYNELIFPLCSGTYYDPKEITIEINLFEKTEPVLKQRISTQYGKYEVRILFVPIREIGRVLSKYKNSVLQCNPRNYLSLSGNPVNKKIRDSILENTTNEFAILNNGITMIATSFRFTEATGRNERGQIIITKPEIINGGQTAYVLSEIFENQNNKRTFGNKEVLLKVIVIDKKNSETNDSFIEEISNATNQQSKVDESDRRSNDPIQIKLQSIIYDKYGYFYQRKKGEFYNGLKEKYLKKDLVIDRASFIRSYLALNGDASLARRSSEKLFEIETFRKLLGQYEKDFQKMFFVYLLFKYLNKLSRNRRNSNWGGTGLKYMQMAIIASIGFIGFELKETLDEIEEEIAKRVKKLESKWKAFEKWAKKQKENIEYLEEGILSNDNYYKGKTVNSNIKDFFGNS